MTGAIVITWGAVPPGREAKALEVFGKSLAFAEELQKSGRIHGHREYTSVTGNQSKWAGMQVLDGEFEELLKLQLDKEWRKLLNEGAAIVQNLTQEICIGGSDQAVQETIGTYTEAMNELGYM